VPKRGTLPILSLYLTGESCYCLLLLTAACTLPSSYSTSLLLHSSLPTLLPPLTPPLILHSPAVFAVFVVATRGSAQSSSSGIVSAISDLNCDEAMPIEITIGKEQNPAKDDADETGGA
jgi:hypothetical protein